MTVGLIILLILFLCMCSQGYEHFRMRCGRSGGSGYPLGSYDPNMYPSEIVNMGYVPLPYGI